MGTRENRQQDLHATDAKQTPDRASDRADDYQEASRQAAGYRATSRSAFRWVGRLLLTALILTAAILFGRQLTELWRPLPELQATAPLLPVFSDPDAVLKFQFGNAPHAIIRQQVSGDWEQTKKQLRDACLRATAGSAVPSEPPTAEERVLLARLNLQQPPLATDAEYEVRQIDPQLPLLVGVHRSRVPSTPNATRQGSPARVVSWALATPSRDGKSGIYVFSRIPDIDNNPMHELDRAIPPEGSPLVQIESGDGALLAYESCSEIQSQIGFYDDYFAARQWNRADDWFITPAGGVARYERKAGDRIETADVQIHCRSPGESTADDCGCWSGIISYAASKLPL